MCTSRKVFSDRKHVLNITAHFFLYNSYDNKGFDIFPKYKLFQFIRQLKSHSLQAIADKYLRISYRFLYFHEKKS